MVVDVVTVAVVLVQVYVDVDVGVVEEEEDEDDAEVAVEEDEDAVEDEVVDVLDAWLELDWDVSELDDALVDDCVAEVELCEELWVEEAVEDEEEAEVDLLGEELTR